MAYTGLGLGNQGFNTLQGYGELIRVLMGEPV